MVRIQWIMKPFPGQNDQAMSKDFDYVYVLFHDENKDKRIEKSIENKPEARILKKIWDEFNVFVKFI